MKLTKLLVTGMLGMGLVFSGAFTAVPSPVVFAEVANNAESVTADGYGAFNPRMPLGQAKIMARRAAIVDAQRNLVEQIQGAQIDAETTMEMAMATSDTVKTKVSGVIRGAKIIAESIEKDGNYKVTLSVPTYGVGSVAQVAYDALSEAGKMPATPAPIAKPDQSFKQTYTPAGSAYTGVIVDARGMELSPTFAPAIYDVNGRVIYGVRNVDKDYAIVHGLVEYTTDESMVQRAVTGGARAGSNPLIIKAVSTKTRIANKCDVVVSVEDANKILAENERTGFLEKYAVVLEK